jgi:hypothetical protein
MRAAIICLVFVASAYANVLGGKPAGSVCGAHGSGVCTGQYWCAPKNREAANVCGADAPVCCNLRNDGLNDVCVSEVHKLLANKDWNFEGEVKAHCEKKFPLPANARGHSSALARRNNCKSQASKKFTAIMDSVKQVCAYSVTLPQYVNRWRAIWNKLKGAIANGVNWIKAKVNKFLGPPPAPQETSLLEGMTTAEPSIFQRIAQRLVDRAAGITAAQAAGGCHFQQLASCKTYLTNCVVDSTDQTSMQSCIDGQLAGGHKICCSCNTWNDMLFC